MTNSTELIVAALDHVYRLYFHRTLSEEARRALIGTPLRKQIRVFGPLEDFGVREDAITAEFVTYYESNAEMERIHTEVTALLRAYAQRGAPTALVTSKNRQELANTLPRLGLADCAPVRVTADDVTNPKPDRECIVRALAELGVQRDRWADAVYVGDTTHDMLSAAGAGIRSIGVEWGAAGREALLACRPTAIVATPGELEAALESMVGSSARG